MKPAFVERHPGLFAISVSILMALLMLSSLMVFRVADRFLETWCSYLEARFDIEIDYGEIGFSGTAVVVNDVTVTKRQIGNGTAQIETLHIDPFESVLYMSHVNLSFQTSQAALRGRVWLDRMAVDLYVSVPPTPCQQIVELMPKEVRSGLEGVTLSGKLALGFHIAMDEETPSGTNVALRFENGCSIRDLGSLPTPNRFRGPFHLIAYDKDLKAIHLVTGPGTARWVPYGEISPYLADAVIVAEDPLFWRHSGVLIDRIKTAIEFNLKAKSYRYGASTITMQLAKNLFLIRQKTLARKIQELFFVWYLERHFQKTEILELYLNVAEFGPSLYGIRDAAIHYFGKPPADLTLLESTFLAKLLPHPTERYQNYKRDALDPGFLKKMRRLLRKMTTLRQITQREYRAALKARIVFHHKGNPPLQPKPLAIPGRTHSLQYSRAARPRLSGLPHPLPQLVGDR